MSNLSSTSAHLSIFALICQGHLHKVVVALYGPEQFSPLTERYVFEVPPIRNTHRKMIPPIRNTPPTDNNKTSTPYSDNVTAPGRNRPHHPHHPHHQTSLCLSPPRCATWPCMAANSCLSRISTRCHPPPN